MALARAARQVAAEGRAQQDAAALAFAHLIPQVGAAADAAQQRVAKGFAGDKDWDAPRRFDDEAVEAIRPAILVSCVGVDVKGGKALPESALLLHELSYVGEVSAAQ